LFDNGVFGPKAAPGFARSADWRVEADRILAATRNKD
jgi:3-hydroxyisobutyrate dehydrogenase